MSKHISCPPRAIATITWYRRLCAELEIENQELRAESRELRGLCGLAPTFVLLNKLGDSESIAFSWSGNRSCRDRCNSRNKRTRLACPFQSSRGLAYCPDQDFFPMGVIGWPPFVCDNL